MEANKSIIWPVFILFEITKHHPSAHRAFLSNKYYRKQYDTDAAQYEILVYQKFCFCPKAVDEYVSLFQHWRITILPTSITISKIYKSIIHFHVDNGKDILAVHRDDDDVVCVGAVKKILRCMVTFYQIRSLALLIHDHKGYLPPFKDLLPYIELWKQIKNV